MRALHRWLVLAVIAAGSAVACTSILGIDTLTNGPEKLDATKQDMTAPDTTPLPPTCTPFHPPSPPDAGDDGGGTSFTLATSAIVLAMDQPDKADIYYDLDNQCTCDIPDAESCVRPLNGGQPLSDTCDLSNGRDGTGNRAIALLTNVQSIKESTLEANVTAGQYGLVISVRGYNGLPDDPQVRVDVARSYGTVEVNGVTTPLKKDGNDPWTYEPKTATDDGKLITSVYFDANAYVHDSVLVAHLPVLVVNIQLLADKSNNHNQISLRLVDVTVTGTVGVSDAGPGLMLSEGRGVGRISASDLTKTLSVWNDPLDMSQGICVGSPLFSTLIGKICERLDLRTNASEDSKGLPCNAMSFGIGFTATPAKVAGPKPFQFAKTTCFDGTADPAVPGTFVCP